MALNLDAWENSARTMDLFPLFLKLDGRQCLVVGAGRVAESKIESLVRCGAKVRVVAPDATEAVRTLASEGAVIWEQRTYQPSDLDGTFLVVAATSSPELHAQIFEQAQRAGVLCNAVDEPERCDFYYPAVVRRGPLQIAISTGGLFPGLAQRLRRQLELQFGPEYGAWVEDIGRARKEILTAEMDVAQRSAQLQEISSERALAEFRRTRSSSGTPEMQSGLKGTVYFVGAGSGDPELLTRKAWRILSEAEVVLHDALVAPELLLLPPASALILDVGKRCGQKSTAQGEIHAMMIEQARAGRTVVRLQGGDPLIFGRASEEFKALRDAGVAFEIVPGITAASAAAAAAQIALTDRHRASRLIFLSAHRHGGQFDTAWQSLPASDATLAIYMPGRDFERIALELCRAGLAPETPCLVVSQASTPEQKIVRADLAYLAEIKDTPAPALLLVGEVTREEVREASRAYRAGMWLADQAADAR
jgi:uroporphyrin-III C-methyltransferase / precorrin-2 dehydrogenase / sirohydrochlorin ferrochelatase